MQEVINLKTQFGWRYVLIIFAVYGLNQGVGEGWAGFATDYFLVDKKPLGMEMLPDERAAIDGVSLIPWQIKALFGIMSDTIPIYGYHRTNYIFIAGLVGTFVWIMIGFIVPTSVLINSSALVSILLLLGNYSIASPDVMIDASIAERSRNFPHLASDMQTICWVSFGVGKILSQLSSGPFYELVGSRGLFSINVLTALAILLPSLFHWLSEERSDEDVRPLCPPYLKKLQLSLENPLQMKLFKLALLLCGSSIGMGLIAKSLAGNDQGDIIIFFITVFVGIFVAKAVRYFENDISPVLADVSVYIFVSMMIQPSTEILFYWYRETPENCNGTYPDRPCLSPTFISSMDAVGSIFFIIGTVVYNRIASKWTYRRIWTTTQILLVFLNLIDLFWIWRLNIRMGISDQLLYFGDEVVYPIVARINTMPVFVLAASLCPEGSEATLFALNMGLSNFGAVMGGYLGIGLIGFLGGIKPPEYKNMDMYILIKSLCKLLPIILIPYLVPKGSPSDGVQEVQMQQPVSTTDNEAASEMVTTSDAQKTGNETTQLLEAATMPQ